MPGRLNLRDWSLRLRALIAPRRVERELDEELAFHIERETQKHIAAGLSPIEARRRALARFGSVPLAADECRDARGVGFVDTLVRDIRYALRTFRRAPLAALTIVATVALGLGLVSVVFTIYNMLVLRVDAVRSPNELFAVALERPTGPDSEEGIRLVRGDLEALRRETAVFTDAFGMLDGGVSPHIDGRFARPSLVTGNFFQVLGVRAALGRALAPDDDERFAPRPVMVLSHAGWQKLFEGDRNVIGRRAMAGDVPYEIVGVMPDGFRGLGIVPPDYWAPLALAGELNRSGEVGFEVVGRLKPGQSRDAASAALSAWASSRAEFKPPPGRPIEASLLPRRGTLPNDGAGLVFAPLFFAFGLILMIGCANVGNLLLARGVARQREIGIRLSLGASRPRVIRQLFTESLLLALAAAVCSLAVVQIFLDSALRAITSTVPPEFARIISVLNVAMPTSDWRVVLFLIAGAVVSTVFFGLAPALQTSRVDLVSTMRGEVTAGGARPRRARHALIALQVGASALLLICAGIFLRGSLAAAVKDPGVRISDTVSVNLDDEEQRPVVLQILRDHPLVTLVAAASKPTRGAIQASASPTRLPVEQIAVSSEYFEVLGLDLVSGRRFVPTERTPDAGIVILSEAVARQLWPGGGGVGQTVRVDAPLPSPPEARSAPTERTLTVIGIVRDAPRASAYLPVARESAGTDLTLRVRGNPDQARLDLVERLPGLDPGFGVMTLRSVAGLEGYLLNLGFGLTFVLGGIALVLTVSGLFSVLSYVVEQQRKEIGVRMALGAATTTVVRLILLQSARPVAVGLAAGGGLAAAVATAILTSSEAEMGSVVNVADPVAYVASLLVIVTSCLIAVAVPAVRATRIDPITTLRQD